MICQLTSQDTADFRAAWFAASTDDGYAQRMAESDRLYANHKAILRLECPITDGTPKQRGCAVSIFERFRDDAGYKEIPFQVEDLALFFRSPKATRVKFWIDNRPEKTARGWSDRLDVAIANEIDNLKRYKPNRLQVFSGVQIPRSNCRYGERSSSPMVEASQSSR